MKTHFLQFADEARAIEFLPEYRYEDQWRTSLNSTAIDIVGTIYKPTGKRIISGDFEYPEQAPIPGFHVNLITGNFPESLAQFEVFPKSPSRVFA